MTPSCLCCDKPLSPVAQFDGWCDTCAGAVLDDVLSLRDSKDVGIKVAMLHDWGCEAMVAAIIGTMPFDGQGLRDHE